MYVIRRKIGEYTVAWWKSTDNELEVMYNDPELGEVCFYLTKEELEEMLEMFE